MLQNIRDNSQGLIAKVIIGLIVAVFALWGVEGIIGGLITTPPIAEVNGEEINELQLQNSMQQVLASVGADAAASLDPGFVEDIALNQLIDEVLLRQSADRSALAVSSERIDRFILNSPQFQIDGVFDQDLAVRTMASMGFSAPLYREDLARRMALSQIANAYAASNFLTEGELGQLIALQRQTRDFRYIAVPMGARTLDEAISPGSIADYYAANQEQFREPESIVARYVALDQDAISGEIEVAPEELLAQYERERGEYQGAAEKRASHILFETFGMTQAEATAAAEAAKQRLDDGEDFAALALELSSDTISARAGGDIGYTDGTAFPPEVEQALNELSLGEISGPVTSEFGVHIVQLTEDAENEYPPFEEVSARIERELKRAEVELIYAGRLEELSNLAFESGDLSGISTQLGLPVMTSEPIGRIGGADIFADPAVVEALFSDEVLLDGNNSEVIELDNTRAAVVRVEQFNESRIRPLEEVEAEITVLLRTEREREAAANLGGTVLAALEAGDDVDALLDLNGLEWTGAEATARNSFTVNPELIEHVFAMPRPEGAPRYGGTVLANGTYVAVELTAVNPGAVDEIPEDQRRGLMDSLTADLGNNDFQRYLQTLREDAEITRSQPTTFDDPAPLTP